MARGIRHALLVACWAPCVTLAGSPPQITPAYLLDNPPPVYTPGAFVQGLLRQQLAPAAQQWLKDSTLLQQRLHGLCTAQPAQQAAALAATQAAWRTTVLSWTRLSAVSIGPLIERRTARHIDFQPARPALIEKAMATPPDALADMDKIGSPAKGIPALEWMLWKSPPPQPGTSACRYAELVGADLQAEAAGVSQGFAQLAQREWLDNEQDASTLMGEVINQWLGAIEQLRWREIGKPLASAQAGEPPQFSRHMSGTPPEPLWLAAWQAIHQIATLQGMTYPSPDGRQHVPVDIYLLGKGLSGPGLTLRQAARDADVDMQQLQHQHEADARQRALKALAGLQQQIQNTVAPALQISIGFSDSDGD